MDSEHSKSSSVNTSFEQAILQPSLNRRVAEFRTSQSLSAVVNAPDKTFSGSLYDYLYNTLVTNGIEENPFVHDVPMTEFQPYITKVRELLAGQHHDEDSGNQSLDDCSPGKCYTQVGREFFDPAFQVGDYLERSPDYIEELGEQLDLTDLTLFREISDRWPLFFSATKDLSGLKTSISDSRALTKGLIRTHENAQGQFLTKSLRFLYCCRRLHHLEIIQEKLELLAAVRQAQPTVQQLLSSGMYSSALEIIGKTQRTISQKLHGLACVRHEHKQLDGMGEVVARLIGGEFIKLCSGYLVQGVFMHKESVLEIVRIGHAGDALKKLFSADEDFSRVEAIVDTVATRDGVLEQLGLLRPVLETQVATELKELMSSMQLRSEKVNWATITQTQLIGMLRTFEPIVEHTLVRLSHFGIALFKRLPAMEIEWEQPYILIKSAIVSHKDGDENYRRSVVSECNHLEQVLVNKFLSKAIKGLKSPAGRLTTLTIPEILEMYEAVNNLHNVITRFIDQRGTPLVQMFLQNEREFLDTFHDKKVKEVAALLEGETWTQIPIPDEFLQMMFQRRVETANVSGLRAEPVEVRAVSCLLMFYKVVYEYLRICQELHIPTETGSRLVDIFKLFNSRVCQLVLGAGATALGHLKTISSKHLGLSAQSIDFLLRELPYIEAKLKISVPEYNSQLAPDVTRVKEDLSIHLQEIYTKLGRIINDRISAKCETAVKDVKWELMLTQNKLEKDYYAQQIVNDMTGMHTILEQILNQEQLVLVFGPILSHLSKCLQVLYRKAPIVSAVSAQRVRNDTQFFLFSTKKLSSTLQLAVKELETVLESIIAERCAPLLTPAAS